MNNIIAFFCFCFIWFLGSSSSATKFDITQTNIKLLVPGKANMINLSSTTYSDSLSNVTFPTFSFTEPTHTDLLTLTLAVVNGTTKVFIGARNYIHRLYVETDYDSKRNFILEETSSKILFFNKSACPTVYADEVGLTSQPTENDLKVVFVYSDKFSAVLFACGTDNCGRCETFKLQNFTIHKSFNKTVDNIADFVGGRKTAFVFEGNYKGTSAFYFAIEPDGRSLSQTPPFFSARTIKKTSKLFLVFKFNLKK